MILQELIDRALSIATVGLDPATASLLADEVRAEDLLLTVFTQVGVQAAREERLRHTLRRTKTLNVVNGTVQLPSDVLSAYITDSVLYDPTDLTKRYAYLAPEHFVRERLDARLGHYSVVGESGVRVTEPGESYDPFTGPTVELHLTIPCVPEVPATANDAIAVSDEVADDLVAALARELRARQEVKRTRQ